MTFGQVIAERVLFAITNPTNVTKAVEAVSTARAKKKNPEGVVAATMETVVYDPIQEEKLAIVRGLKSAKNQLLGLRALEDGNYAFDEFIEQLDE